MSNSPRILFTGASPRGWHRLQTVLECPQKFAWEYRYGKEGFDDPRRIALLSDKLKQDEAQKSNSPALIRGTLIHLGLAHYYARLKETQNGRDPELYLPPEDALRVFCAAQGPHYEEHCEEITACVKGYIDKFQPVDKYKVLHVEELFEARIGGYLFTGRLDLVVEDTRGVVWAFDHKSTGRMESKQREFYSISGQLIGYRWLVRGVYGDRFGGLKINLIQHGNGDFRYERPQLLQAPHLYSRFPQTVIDAERRIAELDDSGRPYSEWPTSMNEMTCYGRYGACKHIEKCKWGPVEP
jgi:hypothetical protein